MPKILIGTSIILLALAGYAGYELWHSQFGPPTEAERAAEQAAEEAAEAVAAEQWNTYTSDQFPFTFVYPPQATVALENDRVKVTYLGPDNTMGSEITDGFTVYIGTRSTSPGDTTESIAATWVDEVTELGSLLEAVEPAERGGRSGHAFTVETGLGTTVRHFVLESEAPYVFTFSQSVIDPRERAYDTLVDRISESLRSQ